MALSRFTADPRHWQIAALAGLTAYGLLGLRFDTTPARAGLVLASALATQWALSRVARVGFDPRSALISALSLCLLLRASELWLLPATALVTVASKFVIRFRGKHVFNPTNFGLVAMALATGQVWTSPGQWGSAAFFAFLMASLGIVVVHRAVRADVTLAFLGCYVAGLCARALWLGDPLAIPIHQLQSGALLLFSFFMISDPRTTPDARAGRILFGALVAAGALYVQFRLYRPGGPLLALFFLSPLVPVLDRLMPGSRYVWKGDSHATPAAPRERVLGPAVG